jgi:acetylcholinesterase
MSISSKCLTGFASFGQSAGAISVNLQMLANGGNNEGLFRGAIMQSGGPIPVGLVDSPSGQRCTSAYLMSTVKRAD